MDATRFAGCANWISRMIARSSTVVFMSQVPHNGLLLVEGCAAGVLDINVLASEMWIVANCCGCRLCYRQLDPNLIP